LWNNVPSNGGWQGAQKDAITRMNALERAGVVARLVVLGLCAFVIVLQAWAWVIDPGLDVYELLQVAGLALLLIFVTLFYAQQSHVGRLREEVKKAQRMKDLSTSVIATLAMAINSKDRHSHGHLPRVRAIACLICREMGLSSEQTEAMETAALLHDVGKLAVPEHILSKPGMLTQEERRKVELHAEVGAKILAPVKFPWDDVLPTIMYHHERWDGGGYPEHLQGERIPPGARILAVADVADALLSPRAYRPPLSYEETLAFIRDRGGSQFDPNVVAAFLRVTRKHDINRVPDLGDLERVRRQQLGRSKAPRPVLEDIAAANQELFALYDVVQTMGASLNLQETLQLLISKTKKIVDYSACVISLIEPETKELCAQIAQGVLEDQLAGMRMPLGSGLSGSVAVSGTPRLAGFASDDLRWAQGEVDPMVFKSCLVVPLPTHERILGTISLYHTEPRAFSDDHQRLLSLVARQAAIAVENARKFEQTERTAMTDGVTDLPNARYLYLVLEQELNRAHRHSQPLALLALDVDDFKSINDTFGHPAGDDVLRGIAHILQQEVRDYDVVVRQAGDEFFAMLPSTDREQAQVIVERIQHAVDDYHPRLHPKRTVRLRVSVGVAMFPDDAEDIHGLIAAADRAMYVDKRAHQQKLTLLEV